MKTSILVNQLAVRVETEHPWGVEDLRNTVLDVVRSYLSMVGFTEGHAYEAEITRVICEERGIDYVFGIDIVCLTKLQEGKDRALEVKKLEHCFHGDHGIFARRAMNDLVSAMKNVEDTGFYCYRAIESLRNHAVAISNAHGESESSQWQRFRDAAGVTREAITEVKNFADPVRHGRPRSISEAERVNLLTGTWGIVQSYIDSVARSAGL